MSLSPSRAVFALAFACAIPLLAGCPKKETPVFDAGPPPPPPEDVQTNLVPMEEDAGQPDADADAKPIYTGKAVNTNVARMKQCCNALATEGKRNPTSPEGQSLINAATQCSAIAATLAPGATAPETGMIRGLLAGRNVPAVCAGF